MSSLYVHTLVCIRLIVDLVYLQCSILEADQEEENEEARMRPFMFERDPYLCPQIKGINDVHVSCSQYRMTSIAPHVSLTPPENNDGSFGIHHFRLSAFSMPGRKRG